MNPIALIRQVLAGEQPTGDLVITFALDSTPKPALDHFDVEFLPPPGIVSPPPPLTADEYDALEARVVAARSLDQPLAPADRQLLERWTGEILERCARG